VLLSYDAAIGHESGDAGIDKVLVSIRETCRDVVTCTTREI
jgi:hypothetical protein